MHLRSAALNPAANNTSITVEISNKLQKKIIALKTKLPALVLLSGTAKMADLLPLMQTLISQWNNKKLTDAERLTIEEYKLIIINAIRGKLSQSVSIPFEVEETLRDKLAHPRFRQQFPGFSLLDYLEKFISLKQLSQEFALAKSFLKRKNIKETDKNILKQYRDFILFSSLYRQSGLSHTHHETILHESRRKILLQRLFFVLPQILQIISNACLYLVELLGKSSLLTFIPNLANPIALGVSSALIIVASVLDFAFGMKLFKDTYGVAFFGQISKSHLTFCEKQYAATKSINQMLADPITSLSLDSTSYASYTSLTTLLNRNIESKIAKEKSEFAEYREMRSLKAARWGLLGFNALLTINSSYFAGASLFALATGATVITLGGWIFIAALIVSSLALLYLQQAKSTFGLLNPTFERFEKLKKNGLKFAANLAKTKAAFKFNLQQKMANESETALPLLPLEQDKGALPIPAEKPQSIAEVGTIDTNVHDKSWLRFHKEKEVRQHDATDNTALKTPQAEFIK